MNEQQQPTNHHYVTTTNRLYLVSEVDENSKPGKTILRGAMQVLEVEPDEEDGDAENTNEIAKDYIAAEIGQKLRTVELKSDNVEAVEEAGDVSRAINYLRSTVESQERKLKSRQIREQLDQVLG